MVHIAWNSLYRNETENDTHTHTYDPGELFPIVDFKDGMLQGDLCSNAVPDAHDTTPTQGDD